MDPISLLPTPPGGAPTPAPQGDPEAGAFKQALEAARAETAPVSDAAPGQPETAPGDVDVSKMALLMALTAPPASPVAPTASQAQATTETQPVPDVTILVPVKKPTIAKAEQAPSAPAPAAPEALQADAPFAAIVDERLVPAADRRPGQMPRAAARPMTADTTGEVALKTGPTPVVLTPVAQPATPAGARQPSAPSPEQTVPVMVERPTPAQAEAPSPAAPAAHAPLAEVRTPPAAQPLASVVEPARPAEAQPAEVVAQIQHAVERMGETRLETVRIQLNPEHLGRIELHVSQASDGALNVQVRAEQPQTVVMLERHLTELRTTLHANQLDVRHVAVSAGTTGDRRQHQGFHGKPARVAIRGLQRAELDATATPAAPGPVISVYPTSRLALAGIDYRI